MVEDMIVDGDFYSHFRCASKGSETLLSYHAATLLAGS